MKNKTINPDEENYKKKRVTNEYYRPLVTRQLRKYSAGTIILVNSAGHY